MPRSTRSMPEKPHLCSISVAFDDQGEIVPNRGTTSTWLLSNALRETTDACKILCNLCCVWSSEIGRFVSTK